MRKRKEEGFDGTNAFSLMPKNEVKYHCFFGAGPIGPGKHKAVETSVTGLSLSEEDVEYDGGINPENIRM